MNKKGFEFSFGWIFALIVGAAILTLAIYAAISIMESQKKTEQSFAGKEIGILLSPIETSLESAKTSTIAFPVRTRVFNNCEISGNFGSQKISTSIESGLGEKWAAPGKASSFLNKYLFSASTVEGKNMILFSKPLLLPYKVADLIFLYSAEDAFCFVNAPKYIEDEIESLELRGVNITNDGSKCSKGSKKVCFGSTGCDIDVDLGAGKVKKNKQTLYYADDENNALIYGAIFADPGIYECQLRRLMKRTHELSILYERKSVSLSSKGCNSNLEVDLLTFSNMTLSLNNSFQIKEISLPSDELMGRNNALACKLF